MTEPAVYRQATALLPGLLSGTQRLIAASRAALGDGYAADRSRATTAGSSWS